ncbi:sugar ABC transporter [Anopheles sinensis]|uniref:Sugar ABC transporter n=1 Tax=Anopheles sinensis TaxID=74873 RepID=A0A084VWK4_ANOSI|nr:sugar ABC transporter [Anopheles sinensis]
MSNRHHTSWSAVASWPVQAAMLEKANTKKEMRSVGSARYEIIKFNYPHVTVGQFCFCPRPRLLINPVPSVKCTIVHRLASRKQVYRCDQSFGGNRARVYVDTWVMWTSAAVCFSLVGQNPAGMALGRPGVKTKPKAKHPYDVSEGACVRVRAVTEAS